LEVEELYRQGLEFSKDIADKKLHRDLLLPFQMHMKLLADLVKMVDTSGAFGTKPRTQPVVIWLFGESGVGKSGMSWPLAIDLNNIFMTNKEDARNFSRNIYMRNVEQEFWDNYQGQNVVIYDDFGQRKDSQAKPNEEFMELIRTANIAPYPLHMAHLEDKRKTKFTSKILLMTSNVF
jgi:DNA replication protein DnaC